MIPTTLFFHTFFILNPQAFKISARLFIGPLVHIFFPSTLLHARFDRILSDLFISLIFLNSKSNEIDNIFSTRV
jgi:hypothetical protein